MCDALNNYAVTVGGGPIVCISFDYTLLAYIEMINLSKWFSYLICKDLLPV